ncbi:linear amide C-N hydrolase [Roseobacter sp. YSTF-M11]|uniref:Linear amide C-N hydrolase n=1 Tax=Roseobacter insulae TaxID=2859783 RepID=A0A9X1FSC7_9RHOB|nr:linear amide C-N hydrolase [Roseobacter insulae]MBW4706896.1 linear amide C-N hydrolase [Roseobacter insulae]
MATVGFILCASGAIACTTIALGRPDAKLVAYSYDVAGRGVGHLIVNPSDVSRVSIMDGKVAAWQARYGSVTFNQIGPGMPTAGMNTAGLVVTLMWNDTVTYPRGVSGQIVNELEFIQRLLDVNDTVDAALRSLSAVRIEGLVPLHFFLADRSGATAVVEPTANGFLHYSSTSLPVPALTNTSYSDLIRLGDQEEVMGGEPGASGSTAGAEPTSLERFAIATRAILASGDTVGPEEAFGVLQEVENSETRWQIVFDPGAAEIHFRHAGRLQTQVIEMTSLDFDCRDMPLSLNLSDSDGAAIPSRLTPLTSDALSPVLGEVLAGFSDVIGIGPEVADGLAMGLLQSATCID